MLDGRLPSVSVLFARKRSIYKKLPLCDVWDIVRDARHYAGSNPVIAHPPCRGWGRLRGLAKPRADEKDLALFAIDQVRRCGGVLEHPAYSSLWKAAQLPLPGPGRVDEFGGFTIAVSQKWWGHRAEKDTWLYICGCSSRELPEMPLVLGDASHVICSSKKRGQPGYRPAVNKLEREATPVLFAVWLFSLAEKCRKIDVG